LNRLHYNIKISGRVQGVWFRKYTVDFAIKTGVNGFVRNEFDRSVYVEAEGELVQLTEFVLLLKKGSPLSNVSELVIEESRLVNFKSFKISY